MTKPGNSGECTGDEQFSDGQSTNGADCERSLPFAGKCSAMLLRQKDGSPPR